MATKPKGKRRVYTRTQKDRALALYTAHGPRAASRKTKIPARTISSWAKRAGLKTEVVAKTAEATEAAAARATRIREELRAKLLDKALEVLGRMDVEHIDFRGKDAKKVTFPRPSPTGVREYAVAVGVLLDKDRLEMGESTDRRSLEHSGSVALQGVPDDELRAALTRLVSKLSGEG
jgi:transposase-like protein